MKINEKYLRWLFPLLIVISFCVNYAGIFDKKLDMNGDNYHYYLLAYNLAYGYGYNSTIGPQPEPHTHFPPGYPAFMSLFMKPFKVGIAPLKLLNGALLLISLLLLFRIVRKSTGRFGLWYALCACLLCTFHTILLRWATILMSEMLYTTISLGIIAICLDLDLEKVRQKDVRHILLLVGLCLLVAAAFFVRTMGISIIMAAALAFFVLAGKTLVRRKKESHAKWWMPALVGTLVLLTLFVSLESWNFRNRRVAPGWKSDYMTSFSIPSEEDMPNGRTAFWLDRIGENLWSFVPYYIPKTLLDVNKAQITKQRVLTKDLSWVAGILVIAVMLVGLLSMKGLQWLLVSYFIITFGVLCLYPTQFSDTRYFVPLIPLMLAAFVVGIGSATEWLDEKIRHKEVRWLPPVVTAALICALLPGYRKSQAVYRSVATHKTSKTVPGLDSYQQYIDACLACNDLPENYLAAVLKPEIYFIYSDFHHAIPLPRTGTPEEVIKYLEDNRVDILIVDTWFPISYRVILPTLMKYPERFSLLWKEGEQESPTLLVGFLVPPDRKPEE